jgi:hypothetical protein
MLRATPCEWSNSKMVGNSSEQDPRWQSVASREAAADGSFVYAVKTTGVYCRPSCPSRTAKPVNVRFYATPADAEAEGFRACRRCHPVGRPAAGPTWDGGRCMPVDAGEGGTGRSIARHAAAPAALGERHLAMSLKLSSISIMPRRRHLPSRQRFAGEYRSLRRAHAPRRQPGSAGAPVT